MNNYYDGEGVSAMDKYYEEGRQAFLTTARYDNPYPYDTIPYEDWQAGWDAREQEFYS